MPYQSRWPRRVLLTLLMAVLLTLSGLANDNFVHLSVFDRTHSPAASNYVHMRGFPVAWLVAHSPANTYWIEQGLVRPGVHFPRLGECFLWNCVIAGLLNLVWNFIRRRRARRRA